MSLGKDFDSTHVMIEGTDQCGPGQEEQPGDPPPCGEGWLFL